MSAEVAPIGLQTMFMSMARPNQRVTCLPKLNNGAKGVRSYGMWSRIGAVHTGWQVVGLTRIFVVAMIAGLSHACSDQAGIQSAEIQASDHRQYEGAFGGGPPPSGGSTSKDTGRKGVGADSGPPLNGPFPLFGAREKSSEPAVDLGPIMDADLPAEDLGGFLEPDYTEIGPSLDPDLDPGPDASGATSVVGEIQLGRTLDATDRGTAGPRSANMRRGDVGPSLDAELPH